jgi:hypothetical protein
MFVVRMIVRYILVVFFFYFIYVVLSNKEGIDNLFMELPIDISTDNSTISIPSQIEGQKGDVFNLGGDVSILDSAIHKGSTFIKPTGPWTYSPPIIDMAIGDDDTGLKWKSDGIVSFMSDTQEIGTFGHDGLNVNGRRTMEFGKGEDKEVNAGKIGYKTWTGNSLDIVGAGRNGEARKVHIWDDLNVSNTASVTNLMEFGANTGKSWNGNGSISYKTPWDNRALNMVGAENSGKPRRIHFWDDVEINGNLRILGNTTIGPGDQRWTVGTHGGSQLHFLHRDTSPGDYNNNSGHILMNPDGNMHITRDRFRGWIADGIGWFAWRAR